MLPPTRIPAPVHAAFALLAAALAAYVVLLLTGEGTGAAATVVYFTLMGSACLLAVGRALVGRDRLVWTLLAAGLASWVTGDVVWELAPPHGVSSADGAYLAFYGFALAALVVLLRRRASGTLRTLWADGGVAALTVAAIAAYFFVEPVIDGGSGGDLAGLLVNLAYPVADTLLLAFVVGAAVAARGAMRASWLGLSAALVVMAVSDGIYLNLSWAGTYVEGTLLEAGWPAAAVALSWAAWTTLAEPAERRPLAERAPIIWPILWGSGSLLVVGGLGAVDGGHPLPIALGFAGVVSVFIRLMLTDAQNRGLARAAHLQALTDPVTGLGNHRALMGHLDDVLGATPASQRVLLAVFDLDGFKDYNDLFGHPAGDALLARLGGRLAAAVGATARAFRMGGDEFCVVAVVDAGAEPDLLLSRIGRALAELGDGFAVTASGGHVLAAPGATSASAALSAADERMYATKHRERTSSIKQAAAVLAAALDERAPGHGDRAADLGARLARALGMGEAEVAHVALAARLHDVGKLALPDAILGKPGPLDDDELEFVRRHTLAGERIAAAAPALAPVAALIRASHERWDGAGYPDGLAGEAIPLGGRIVFVVDAFAGMTSARAYRPALGDGAALAELARNAGTQFDPAVVGALGRVLGRGDEPVLLAA